MQSVRPTATPAKMRPTTPQGECFRHTLRAESLSPSLCGAASSAYNLRPDTPSSPLLGYRQNPCRRSPCYDLNKLPGNGQKYPPPTHVVGQLAALALASALTFFIRRLFLRAAVFLWIVPLPLIRSSVRTTSGKLFWAACKSFLLMAASSSLTFTRTMRLRSRLRSRRLADCRMRLFAESEWAKPNLLPA